MVDYVHFACMRRRPGANVEFFVDSERCTIESGRSLVVRDRFESDPKPSLTAVTLSKASDTEQSSILVVELVRLSSCNTSSSVYSIGASSRNSSTLIR